MIVMIYTRNNLQTIAGHSQADTIFPFILYAVSNALFGCYRSKSQEINMLLQECVLFKQPRVREIIVLWVLPQNHLAATTDFDLHCILLLQEQSIKL